MSNFIPRLILYSAAQVIAVSLAWHVVVRERDWSVVQQFFGHIGPAVFLVAMGAAALIYRHNLRALAFREAWLAIVAGASYVLADTFLMHPPFGVFSDPGHAEQEHVSIMALVFVLGVSGLVVLRKSTRKVSTSAHFLIGIGVAGLVFLGHHQHTEAGSVGHYATVMFLGIAALFRVLDKTMEYAVAMIVTGFVFFSSQMGFADFVDTADNSPGAWVALWATLGFASATGFMAMSSGDDATVPAE
jgi:hypothetical protein